MKTGAELSPCGTYRYSLWRAWGDGPRAVFVMLNPSTADAARDDPTIRRCIGFARAWGFNGLEVVNLFALRATNPEALYLHADPVGPENDDAIATACNGAGIVVAAWGVHGAWKDRGQEIAQRIAYGGGVALHHLGLTKGGHPRHPLYLASATQPERWHP